MRDFVCAARFLRVLRFFLPFLFVFWAAEAAALSGTISALDLIKFLNDYRNSTDQHKQSLAADLQQRLAQAGVTFNESGFLVSGTVPASSFNVLGCDDLKTVTGITTVLSGGSFFGPAVGPTSGDVNGGSWSTFLNGNATAFSFDVNRSSLGFGLTLGGDITAGVSGTLHWSGGFWEPEFKCNWLGFCWVEFHWACHAIGGEGFDVSLNGNFSARAGLTLDAVLEQNSTGRYQVVLGRQALANPTGPLTGTVDPNIGVRVSTDFIADAVLVNAVAGGAAGDRISDKVKAKVDEKIAALNVQIRAQLPIVYELPDVDPLVRKLVAQIVDSPALHRFVEQNFQQILFYLLVNDRDALVQLVTSSAACEGTKLARAGMPTPPLYTDVSGACAAADPAGPDAGRYFADGACSRPLAFRPTPYQDFCAEILTPAPNALLGNAAAWTADAGQPNDPLPSVASRKWTLPQGAQLNIGAESIAGKTVPFMKRVRYRDVATTTPIFNVTALWFGCALWHRSLDPGDTCATWGTATGAQPADESFVLLGYIKTVQEPGTAPVSWHCSSTNMDNDCIKPVLVLGGIGDDRLVGYVRTVPGPGTVPLYSRCMQQNSDGDCTLWGAGTSESTLGGGLLGYLDSGTQNSRGNCALEMRVYKKDPFATQLTPLIAFHGGSWKYRGGGFVGLEAAIAHYTEQDFVVFAPFYRLVDTVDGNTECNGAPWQSVVADAEAALDWVRAHGTAFGAKPEKPAVMGQSAGAHLSGWLLTHRSADVAGGLLLYAPSDMTDFLTQVKPGGLYQGFTGSLPILSTFFGVDVGAIDLASPPDLVGQNSFHELVRQGGGSVPPAFIVHGRADVLVPSNQSVLLCNAYGGSAVDNGGGANRRAIYACGPSGGQLHLFEQGEHALDFCLTTDVAGLCFSGDAESRTLVADSMRQARAWLQGHVNVPPTANAGSSKTVLAGSAVSLPGSGTDPDGIIVSYAWTQTAGPIVALANALTATAAFTAPQVSASTVLTFRLTVTDDRGAAASATVSVTVTPPAPPPPTPIPNLAPLYFGCVQWNRSLDPGDTCARWSTASAPMDETFVFLGYIKTVQEGGTAPFYWACSGTNENNDCVRPYPSVGWGAELIGFVRTVPEPGTVALYSYCLANADDGCPAWGLSTTPRDTFLGYIYYTTMRP
jgi:acetyl esterase/lipase